MGFGQAIGNLVGAYGSLQQGAAAKAAGSYNGAVLDAQSRQALDDASENVQRLYKNEAADMGAARAMTAASGIVGGDGSGLMAEMSVAKRYAQEVADVQTAGMRDARNLQSQANMARWEGAQKARASRTAAAGGLLSGFMGIGEGVYNLKK